MFSNFTRPTGRLGFFACVLAVTQAFCGGIAQPPPADLPRAKELVSLRLFSSTPENVGEVARNAKVARVLQFSNLLKHPVKVEVLSKSCGCIDAAFDSAEVPPEGSTSLTFSLAAAPSAVELLHSVTFRVFWQDGNEERSERGVCTLRYRTRMSWFVQPDSVSVVATAGGNSHADVFVVANTEDGPLPSLSDVQISLPAWTVTRIDGPGPVASVGHFRLQGPTSDMGVQDGVLTMKTGVASDPTIGVPIRVRTLSRFRATPGGFIFLRGAGDGQSEQAVRLDERAGGSGKGAKPASVRFVNSNAALSGRLLPDGGLSVKFAPQMATPQFGSARCEVLSAEGELLASLPVAWWTREEAAESKK